MANKVVSVALLHRKKPFKSINKTKKLKKVLKNVFNYMKSDTYMFAPLISSHSHNNLTSSPASYRGEMSSESFIAKEKNIEEYLKYNSYMYAPLFLDSASDGPNPLKGDQCGEKTDTGRAGDHQMETRTEDKDTQDGNTTREVENGKIPNLTKRIVVKHNLLHRETVKHVVHQNSHSSLVPGKVLPQKKARKVVE